MSTQDKDTKQDEQEQEQELLQPVSWINGLSPLYILPMNYDAEQAIEDIQAQGFPIFYMLGEKKTTTETKQGNIKKTITSVNPALFKVVKNLVGNAVSEVSMGSIGLGTLDNSCFFSLPGIPWSLIQKVDDFFRAVEDEHDTESIVLFTYDEEYSDTDSPQDGWGIVVPEQTNTVGSCDYKPESIVEQLPDDPHKVSVVGSAHSHPGMAAYCSGTDKNDQASFDGIHITFGWKDGSRQTEFHIELQMGGQAYTLPEAFAFSDVPDFNKNKEIESWKKQVTKKKAASTQYGGHQSFVGGNKSPVPKAPTQPARFKNLPEGLPPPSGKVTIVVALSLSVDELKDCPVCEQKLPENAIKKGKKCPGCQSYFLTDDLDDIEDLIKHRNENGHRTTELDVDDETAWKDIYLWREVGSGANASDDILLVRSGRHSDLVKKA